MESGNLENPRCHVWAGASICVCASVCVHTRPSRLSVCPNGEVAEKTQAHSTPCQRTSEIRTTVRPTLGWPQLTPASPCDYDNK